MTRHQANAVLLLAGALWGMGFVAQSTAMGAIGPFTFIALRFLVATLAMLPFAVWEGRRATPVVARHQWRQFAVIGILMFGAIATQQVGLMTTSVTNSGFLTGLYVVMVPLLAVGLFREWPHRVVWPASLSALAGIFMLSGGYMERLTTGDWLTILCALFCALQMIFIARFVGDSGKPITLAVTQFAVCAGLGFAVALPLEPFETGPILEALPEVLYAGIVSGGMAFTLQVIGQRYTTASQAALFLSTEAVFAALFGAILLGERLPPIGLAGCALIFAAILSVEIVPNRRRVSP